MRRCSLPKKPLKTIRPRGEAGTKLTAREDAILWHLASGYSVKEIAGALNVSPKTVEAHRTNLMTKLNIHKTVLLVPYAMERGLIPIPRLMDTALVPIAQEAA